METQEIPVPAGGAGKLVAQTRGRAVRFLKDENGGMTWFCTVILLIILMVGGAAVDIMRNEMNRTRIQSVTDRAALAAADLEQTLDPRLVVRSYFKAYGLEGFIKKIEPKGFGTPASGTVSDGRSVHIQAEMTAPSDFLRLVGVKTLKSPAISTAQEKVTNVEISLVLDISGSMRHAATGGGTKIGAVKTAATKFVYTVLNDDAKDRVSLSVVPYSGQVNAGPEILGAMNVNKLHDYSHCVEFAESDFSQTDISTTTPMRQGQHFTWYHQSLDSKITKPDCPMRKYERIHAISQDKHEIAGELVVDSDGKPILTTGGDLQITKKGKIQRFTHQAFTAIHYGAKWGITLLDPSFRKINKVLTKDSMDATFSERPLDFGSDVQKHLVLMTDGQNVDTRRINWEYYNEPSEVAHWNYNSAGAYYDALSSTQRDDFISIEFTAARADTFLKRVCKAAKDKNIVVWTIAFEMESSDADVMEACASSKSHHFNANGTNIQDVFQGIAAQIMQLKLTL